MDDITEEISYTLLSLEAPYGHTETCAVEIWSEKTIPRRLVDLLQNECGGPVALHDLQSIPPVSEGLALRTAERRLHHVELVPREWIEIQRRKRLIKVATIASIGLMGLWLAIVAVTGVVFSVKQAAFNRVHKEAARYEGPARAAQAARTEMLSLEAYSDRSHSALECLRAVTEALPDGVEIASFSYKNGEAVSLRGTADRAEAIYDFFQHLGTVEIFSGVKDEQSSNRMIKEKRVTTFSVKAELPQTKPEGTP
jgi:hypothetical protein